MLAASAHGGMTNERRQVPGACDTHMHFYDSRYTSAPSSLLRPPDATVEQFRQVQAGLDLRRVVVVQPSTYESSLDPTHQYADVTRLVHALVEHAPERMLWATNWPHPGQANPPSLHNLSRLALEWMPDALVRRRILVDNPATLYGFDPVVGLAV